MFFRKTFAKDKPFVPSPLMGEGGGGGGEDQQAYKAFWTLPLPPLTRGEGEFHVLKYYT